MADHTFTFRLVTPQRLLFEGPVASLQVPGSEGYLGILAHHAPLITTLRPGKLEVRDPAGALTVYAVSGGFLEVSANRATMLADAVETVDEIDRERATLALRRADARLRDGGPTSAGKSAGAATTAAPESAATEPFDRDRAQRALERAKNRLALAKA